MPMHIESNLYKSNHIHMSDRVNIYRIDLVMLAANSRIWFELSFRSYSNLFMDLKCLVSQKKKCKNVTFQLWLLSATGQACPLQDPGSTFWSGFTIMHTRTKPLRRLKQALPNKAFNNHLWLQLWMAQA